MQNKTAPQLSVCGAVECCRMTIFTGGFSMENIRIYEEDGYIHFIMRPEDLMRLRYSTEAKTPFADFMDRWLTQMKTQVRENTMDGYRYAFEKHIKPFFTARGTTLATARPMDFQDFVNLKFDQGLSPTSIVKFHSIMHKCLKYAVALQIIPTNPSDNVMLPKRTRFRDQHFSGSGAAVTGRGGVCAGGNLWSAPQRVRRSALVCRGFSGTEHGHQSYGGAVLRACDLRGQRKDQIQLSDAAAVRLAPAVSDRSAPQTERQPQKVRQSLLPERLRLLP